MKNNEKSPLNLRPHEYFYESFNCGYIIVDFFIISNQQTKWWTGVLTEQSTAVNMIELINMHKLIAFLCTEKREMTLNTSEQSLGKACVGFLDTRIFADP